MSENKKNVAFAESLHKQELKYAPDQVNMAAGVRKPDELENIATRQAGAMDEQFPTDSLTAYDKRDRLMNAKLQLGEGMPMGYTPFGKLEAKDEDFKWLQKKEAAAELANFQQWFAKEFDLMSPAQKKRAKELYPEFYAERKKLLKKQAKNLFDLARIKLEGIDNYKDLVKTYMAETGRLDLGPLENLLNPERTNKGKFGGMNGAARNEARFQRGLANPFTVFGKEVVPATTATRQHESDQWAVRDNDANRYSNLVRGVAKTGFPAFKGHDLNQSDEQWFQVLKQGMGTQ